MPDDKDMLALQRWRLVLGRFSEPSLGGCGGGKYGRMDRALDFLYGREYGGRGIRTDDGRPSHDRRGGTGASAMILPEWLAEVRELFPQDTVEIVERHALERYNMTELVTDPEVLSKLEPNYELLKTILTFRGMMKGDVLELARSIVRKIIDDLRRKLDKEVRRRLWGHLNRLHHSPLKVAKNLDVRRTIRTNLKNYDAKNKRIILERLHFFSRVERHNPWHIIMAVDCSGSMMDSIIHSAVMAGIFNGLPSMRVNLIAFDTDIVDFTEQIDDPVELLMSVHMGGGTDIGKAIRYCETLVQQPTRTIVLVVTDFFEGGPRENMLGSIKRLREAGVRVLGLAALDSQAKPVYDKEMAQRCVDAGAEVAALTPQRLAAWMEQVLR